DSGAGDGRHVAPGLEAFLGGIECEIQVGLAGVCHAADLFAGGRVEHGQRLASSGFAPFAVDEKSGVWIAHGGLLLGTGIAKRVHLTSSQRHRLRGAGFRQPGQPDMCSRRRVHGAWRNARRYCTDSATWLAVTCWVPARSAMVRATRRARWVLRALHPSRAAAVLRNFSAADSASTCS